ncbi:PKD domain-containing protein, partial [candidate division GN15 bacterium]|nr:PKD domain-containing protein [candidate division GN15 bacterium]
AENNFGPAPLAVDLTVAAPFDSITSCSWTFGDGSYGYEAEMTHVYEDPGCYDVSTIVETPHGQFRDTIVRFVSSYADTLHIDTVKTDPGSCACVDIELHNCLPIREMIIPFTWEGALQMSYDSFSVEGARTEYFELVNHLHYDLARKRATIYLGSSSGDSQPYLTPGDGLVLKLWFTIPPSMASGSNPISLTSYGGYAPELCSYAGWYDPEFTAGVVSIAGCCAGASVGNVDGSPDNAVTLGDLTSMIDHLFVSLQPLACWEEADLDFSGQPEPGASDITLGDLTLLINHLFVDLQPLPPCP